MIGPTGKRMNSKKLQERHEAILYGMLKDPDNKKCFDCGGRSTSVNMTAKTFVCTRCSGLLREFNQRIKSISASIFTANEIELIQQGGNKLAEKIWLATWQPRKVPDEDWAIKDFMREKYVACLYYRQPDQQPVSLKVEGNFENISMSSSPSKNSLITPARNTNNRRSADLLEDFLESSPRSNTAASSSKGVSNLPAKGSNNLLDLDDLFSSAAPTNTTAKAPANTSFTADFSSFSNSSASKPATASFAAFPPSNHTAPKSVSQQPNANFVAEFPAFPANSSNNPATKPAAANQQAKAPTTSFVADFSKMGQSKSAVANSSKPVSLNADFANLSLGGLFSSAPANSKPQSPPSLGQTNNTTPPSASQDLDKMKNAPIGFQADFGSNFNAGKPATSTKSHSNNNNDLFSMDIGSTASNSKSHSNNKNDLFSMDIGSMDSKQGGVTSTTQPRKQSTTDLFSVDFGSQPKVNSSIASAKRPSKSGSSVDLFSVDFGSSSSSTKPQPASSSSSNVNDLFSLDFGGGSSTKTNDLKVSTPTNNNTDLFSVDFSSNTKQSPSSSQPTSADKYSDFRDISFDQPRKKSTGGFPEKKITPPPTLSMMAADVPNFPTDPSPTQSRKNSGNSTPTGDYSFYGKQTTTNITTIGLPPTTEGFGAWSDMPSGIGGSGFGSETSPPAISNSSNNNISSSGFGEFTSSSDSFSKAQVTTSASKISPTTSTTGGGFGGGFDAFSSGFDTSDTTTSSFHPFSSSSGAATTSVTSVTSPTNTVPAATSPVVSNANLGGGGEEDLSFDSNPWA